MHSQSHHIAADKSCDHDEQSGIVPEASDATRANRAIGHRRGCNVKSKMFLLQTMAITPSAHCDLAAKNILLIGKLDDCVCMASLKYIYLFGCSGLWTLFGIPLPEPLNEHWRRTHNQEMQDQQPAIAANQPDA